jgi:uncharacterized SAM-binding protein YcdF (DUF218 family)
MPVLTAKRALVGILLVVAIAVAAFAYGISRAGYWLQAPAQAPVHADAIIVLGGNDGDRALRALGLFKAGYAPKIVLTGLERGPGFAACQPHLARRISDCARRAEIGGALRVLFREQLRGGRNILELMKKQGWRTVIAVSDPPHMRRLAWTWHRVFKDRA